MDKLYWWGMKNLSFLCKNLIAHRGVHYAFEENTLSSFQMAIEKKYAIELDVHLSLDQEIVVFHDYSLERLYHEFKLIKDLSFEELKKYHIPSLRDVLKLVAGRVPIIIEIKSANNVLYQKLIDLLDNYKGDFAIQSFSFLTLLYFKKVRPQYVIGWLVRHSFQLYFFSFLKFDYVGVRLSLLKKCVFFRKRHIVIGYTIKTEEQYLSYVLEHKADNFICDIPRGGFTKKQETVPLRTVSQKE